MRLVNRVTLAVVLTLAVNTTRAYEVLFAGGTNGGASVVHKIPIAHNLVGVVERGNVLENAESLPDILKLKDVNGLGAATLQFKDGRLVRFQRNGDNLAREKDEKYLRENPDKPTQLVDIWRKPSTSDESAWRYWDASSRLRLWFFNPNGAGTLFAEVALVLLSAAMLLFRKKAVRVAVACGAVVPVVFLVMTSSRGSLVALVVGCIAVVVGFAVSRKVNWKFLVVAILASVVLLGVCAVGLGGERFGKNLVAMDVGNVQRVCAWRAAPAMLASAQGGWGKKCGRAYDEWFQREDDTHALSYLVNTHLTWMVEKGWVFSFFYAFGWTLLFSLLLTNIREKWNAMSLGMWVLFFVANWFSTLGFFVSLWILPIFCTVPAAVNWVRGIGQRKKSYLVVGLVSPAFALGVVFCMIAVGKADLSKMDVPVRNDGRAVYIGAGDPVAYVVPDLWVLSRYNFGSLGREIRSWCKAHEGEGSIALVDSVQKLPKKSASLVLVGRACGEYMKCVLMAAKDKSKLKDIPTAERLVFISPNLAMGKISDKLAGALHLHVYSGEFLAEVTGDSKISRSWLKTIPGCELYLPDWLGMALKGDSK